MASGQESAAIDGPLFAQLEIAVSSAQAEDLPAVMAALAAAQARALARIAAPAQRAEPADDPDRLLTPEQASEIAAVDVFRIYSWAKGARWAQRPSRRCLRISESGFRRWLASKA